MINKLTIKNFRSIDRTTIQFPDKFCVIIGANGSGKTNVLLALNFITNCLVKGPTRAIQIAGGLNQVFRVKERRANECGFTIELDLPDRSETHRIGFGKQIVKIDESAKRIEKARYGFAIKYEDREKRLKVSKETVEVFENEKWTTIYDKTEETSSVDIEEDSLILNEMAKKALLSIRTSNNPYYEKKYSLSPARDQALYIVFLELSCVLGYNFYPNILRRESDLLSFDTMGYNGQGYSSLIYRLYKDNRFFRRLIRNDFSMAIRNPDWAVTNLERSFKHILPFISRMNPSEAIDSTHINLRFNENHSEGKEYNISHLSDGSVKFLATSTAIFLMNYSVLCLEEIENYLNPKAIAYLIEQMKLASDKYNVQFILTTHSETVLNLVKPSEILISQRNDSGTTNYRKPLNMKSIQNELDASGFGLGTYWAAGGID